MTTSLDDPLGDLETNLIGTLNVLEARSAVGAKPSLLFTSTNKVYGRLASVGICEARQSI